MLESFPHLMPSQLDAHSGALLAAHVAAAGVRVRAAVHVRELLGDRRVSGDALEEGGLLPTFEVAHHLRERGAAA